MVKIKPPIYLATPYSKYQHGIKRAFIDAATLTAKLLKNGVHVYSPIVHMHPVAIYGDINPFAHNIWLPANGVMMECCQTLFVARLEGWDVSKGVAYEIAAFALAGKPIYDLDPETLVPNLRVP